MYRILCTLTVGVLLCSCTVTDNQKKKLADELRLFREVAITFPDNLLAKRYDEQAPDISLLNRPLKMVVYVNREGCGSCKITGLLPVYQFILENRHVEKFGMVVILSPSHIKLSDDYLEQFRLRQTFFFDLDGSFERLNPHLPENERFHTFLLDENNKVVLVGNPVRNTKLKNLYLAELNKYN